MLQEFWDFLTTPASKNANSDGYLYQAIALSYRAKRCEKFWTEHLHTCHQQLEQRMRGLPDRRSVAVLGSGLLLETPLFLLQKYFQDITLLDVVHTKKIRQEVKKWPRIQLLELDLNQQSPEGKFDCVISANLLSQLPLMICAKMLKQKQSPEKISEKAIELQRRHLQLCKALAKNGILYSDLTMQIIEGDGVEEHPTVDPSLAIVWEQTWLWNLAPAPEVDKKKSIQLIEGIFSW